MLMRLKGTDKHDVLQDLSLVALVARHEYVEQC
jgi:hypothetical protein